MKIVAVVLGVLSVIHSANAFGLGAVGGGGASNCCPQPPPPPPACPPPAPACGPPPVQACPPPPPPCPPPQPPPQTYCPEPPACPVCPPPQPPPPCPPQPPPPSYVCPPPVPCPTGPVSSCSQAVPQSNQNDCCHKCGDTCRFKSRKAYGVPIDDRTVDPMCNSAYLHAIMINNMSDSITDSKRAIQKSAELKFEVKFDVICATGGFSYVVNSALFCQATLADVTCYAFKH